MKLLMMSRMWSTTLVEPETLLVSGVATLMMLITDCSVVEVVKAPNGSTVGFGLEMSDSAPSAVAAVVVS